MAHLPLRETDNDLIPILRQADSEDLGILVEYLHKNWNQDLSSVPAFQEQNPDAGTKKYDGDHTLYADDIAAEIQRYGGNSFSNTLRGGKGVDYIEILRDVADHMKVNYNKNTDAAAIEAQIQLKVLESAYEKMSQEERKELLDGMGVDHGRSIPTALPIVALQSAIQFSGFAAYKLAAVIAKAIAKVLLGRALPFAAYTALSRWIAVFAGPVGLAITGLWTAIDLAGPAYRVTVPCVLQVAYIRQKSLLAACPSCGEMQSKSTKFCSSCGAEMGTEAAAVNKKSKKAEQTSDPA